MDEYNNNYIGDTAAAGMHNEGARANHARVTDILEAGYHWERKRLPTPGAQNYAFETLGLVEFDPVGPGILSRQFFAVTEPPQVYITGQSLTTTGYGGIVAGQIITQPLLDPYNETYG